MGLAGGLAFSGAVFRVLRVLWVVALISALAGVAGRCLFGACGPFNLVLLSCMLGVGGGGGGGWSSRLIFFFFLCGH